MTVAPSTLRTDSPSNENLRVVFLHDHLGYAQNSIHGVTSYFAYVIPELHKRGIEASLCVLSREHSSKQWLESLGVQCTFLEKGKFDPTAIHPLNRHLKSKRPNICHAAGFKSILFSRALAASGSFATVIHIHDSHSVPAWMRPWQRSLGRYTGAAIAVSAAAKSVVRQFGVPLERTHILHNGVPVERFRGVAAVEISSMREELALLPGCKIVVTIGQVRREKGQWVLLEAMKHVVRECSNTMVLFAGEGPDLRQLEKRTMDLDLQQHTRWLGFRSDIPVLLNLADVVVVPSTIAEGFGFPAIEGYACGVPAIGSRIGGIPEVIIDGRTGLLVPPADIESLANAVCSVIQNDSLRQVLARGARDAAERFSVQNHVEQLIPLYRQAMVHQV